MKLTKAEIASIILAGLFIVAAALVINLRPDGYAVRVETVSAAPPGAPAFSQGEPVNINTAGLDELDALPGIGPVIAERIIAYRAEHGAFSSPQDITLVEGVGSETFDKIKPYITTN